ncbi:MAG TPA: hypothetical protein VMR74_14730 [Gammaproteobacteria bacterium]|nr:hypothetical protein [Gammaproteobacteria bacterium]
MHSRRKALIGGLFAILAGFFQAAFGQDTIVINGKTVLITGSMPGSGSGT